MRGWGQTALLLGGLCAMPGLVSAADLPANTSVMTAQHDETRGTTIQQVGGYRGGFGLHHHDKKAFIYEPRPTSACPGEFNWGNQYFMQPSSYHGGFNQPYYGGFVPPYPYGGYSYSAYHGRIDYWPYENGMGYRPYPQMSH